MAQVELTHHARTRAQQRGIPSEIVGHLYFFGESRNSKGAQTMFLTRQSLADAAAVLSKQEVQRLQRFQNAYLIVGDEQRIVTAARANRKQHFSA
ncbi:MAG TPA: hypothetical protein DEB63_21785 [Agrobacterium sp.]|uniref:hypothetical protein n=1 Tax=Rhizobium/Agrobacterium group TaxID=227290 RepID=UPI000E84C9D1|nr:hypothetical protein [Agrobacterium sp.]MCD4659767.1 hypothetical protein [Agrobacterium sp.]HBT70381.1 hypothetical protein [Agrobacterium sp.]